MKKRASRKPRAVPKLPVIVHYPIMERPRCSQDISTPEALRYRDLPDVRRRYESRGVTGYGCGNQASYRIGDEWFCTKHAGAIALALLSVEADEP